jgi:hypothetical protein
MTIDLVNALAANDHDDRKASAFIDPRNIPTRYSLLKKLDLSPAHYLEACQEYEDDSLKGRLASFASDRTEAFRIGGAIHAMLTGGKVVVYGGRRDPRAKAWQEFQVEAADKGVAEILIASEMALVRDVADAIRAREDAMRLLFDGTIVEQRIHWKWMGKEIGSTPDARCKAYTVDLKSARSSHPESFRRQSRSLFYHAQAELYGHAMEEVGEGRPPEAYVIAVEKKRPYPVTIFRFTDEMLELGAKMNRKWMERLLQCEHANHWPGYTPVGAVVDLDVDEEWQEAA